MRRLLLGAAGLLVAGLARGGCGDDLPADARRQIDRAGLTLAFAPRPWPVEVGRHFAVDIVVCAAATARAPAPVGIDADMPLHRHGMNYRPTVQALGGDRYAVEGLMFHMPGRWRFIFELGSGAERLRLVDEVDVE